MTSPPPSKAMVLAAGEGLRLRPLTERLPKCMIRVGGKPVLEHTLAWLRRHGVTEVIVNLYHRPEAIREHFGDGRQWGLRLAYSDEDQPLGTAGGVKKAAWFFDGPFFVWYGDNLSTCRLDRLWQFHRQRGASVTIALHQREDPTQSGVVAFDQQGRVTRFLEKPRPGQVFSHWVNAGILALEPEALASLPGGGPLDFGKDVFPAWLEAGLPLYAYRLSPEEKLVWIDTLEDLERAQTAWPEELT